MCVQIRVVNQYFGESTMEIESEGANNSPNDKKIIYYKLPFMKTYWPQVKPKLDFLAKTQFTHAELIQSLCMFNKMSGGEPDDYPGLIKDLPLSSLRSTFSKVSRFVLQQESFYGQYHQRFPIFKKGRHFEHIYTKRDVILIMCLMALCLSHEREKEGLVNFVKKTFNKSNISSFMGIYQGSKNKIAWILFYFDLVFDREDSEITKEDSFKVIRNATIPFDQKYLASRKTPLSNTIIRFKGSIQDYQQEDTIRIDFANKRIGGGSLGHACVQEEIMFLNHTELFITMLFCEKMEDNEAIGMQGFKKYFTNSGYAKSTKFEGEENSMTYYRDPKEGILNDYIVAIDALCHPSNQFSTDSILRQINKSYSGFSIFAEPKSISTGNWGCGAFGGDPQLKFIIQWLSASLVSKTMIYYTYNKESLSDVMSIVHILKGRSVGEVFKALLSYEQYYSKVNSLFSYIKETAKKREDCGLF